MEQQASIAEDLNMARAPFDHLTTTVETAISLFIERRASLISAAVTGKIDVREVQPA